MLEGMPNLERLLFGKSMIEPGEDFISWELIRLLGTRFHKLTYLDQRTNYFIFRLDWNPAKSSNLSHPFCPSSQAAQGPKL